MSERCNDNRGDPQMMDLSIFRHMTWRTISDPETMERVGLVLIASSGEVGDLSELASRHLSSRDNPKRAALLDT